MERFTDSAGPGIVPKSDLARDKLVLTQSDAVVTNLQEPTFAGAGNAVALKAQSAVHQAAEKVEQTFPNTTAELQQLGRDLKGGVQSSLKPDSTRASAINPLAASRSDTWNQPVQTTQTTKTETFLPIRQQETTTTTLQRDKFVPQDNSLGSTFSNLGQDIKQSAVEAKDWVAEKATNLTPNLPSTQTQPLSTGGRDNFHISTEGLPVKISPAPELSTGIPAETLQETTILSTGLEADSQPSSLRAAQLSVAQGKEGLIAAPSKLETTVSNLTGANKPLTALAAGGNELANAVQEEFISGESITSGTETVPSLPLEKVGAVVAASAAVLASGLSNISHKVAEALPGLKAKAEETVEMVRENAPILAENARYAANVANEKLHQAVPVISGAAHSLGNSASNAAHVISETASNTAHAISETASHTAHNISDSAKGAVQTVSDTLHNTHITERARELAAPVTEGVSNLGTKAAGLLPGQATQTTTTTTVETTTTDQLAATQPLSATASNAAHTVGERVHDMVESIQGAATSAFTKVKDTTNQAVDAVKDTANRAVDTVRSSLPGGTTTSTVVSEEHLGRNIDTGIYEHKQLPLDSQDISHKNIQSPTGPSTTLTQRIADTATAAKETVQSKVSQTTSGLPTLGALKAQGTQKPESQKLPVLTYKQQDLQVANVTDDQAQAVLPSGVGMSATPGLAALAKGSAVNANAQVELETQPLP